MRIPLPRLAPLGAALLLVAAPAAAQPAAPPPQPPAAAAPGDFPIARVNGEIVRASDVIVIAAEVLPAEMRALPGDQLLDRLPPEIVERLVERAIAERALVIEAKRQGLEQHALVRQRVARVEAQELQQALLAREAVAAVTEADVRARFDRDVANRGEPEVQARHILVATEAEARAALAEIAGGADFAAVAARRSSDPGSRANGGDLGFFKRGQMVPEFGTAAFALQAGQVSPEPVRTPFGWHVIKVEARRTPEPPPYAQARDEVRGQLLQEKAEETVRRIRLAATVERLDRAGAPAPASPPAPRGLLDGATPPPATPPPATPPARR